MINRANKFCKYYPCHKDLEDCTFCYCPLYPCKNKNRGEYIMGKADKKIWSCMNCNWIHKKKTVDGIFRLIKQNMKK